MESAKRWADEQARLSTLLAKDRGAAVPGLRALEESWARQLLGLPAEGSLLDQIGAKLPALASDAARDALVHLKSAEEWQWEIGTWSTSGGEGIASMVEVHTLQLAQAWLHLALGAPGPAKALADEVASSPNNLGEDFFKETLAALRRKLR